MPIGSSFFFTSISPEKPSYAYDDLIKISGTATLHPNQHLWLLATPQWGLSGYAGWVALPSRHEYNLSEGLAHFSVPFRFSHLSLMFET